MKKSYYLIIITLVLSACNIRVGAADIALYSDRGASEDCVIATKHMFDWMGLKVELIDASHINRRPLDGYRIICFPGGNMYQYAQDIAESGKDKIREFISSGGGYIGICGGAYFTGERVFWQSAQLPMSPLGIFPGTTQGPIDAIAPYPDCVMCKIDIIEHNHPITKTESDSAWIMYCYGPMLLPDNSADVTILGRYDILDQPAMITFEYGEGRVFIVGVHPELEEDSERDGVNFGDEFNDRGSDWNIMRKATFWCLGESVE
jgi:glutamine amidotransferase-like uncharacterized protein